MTIRFNCVRGALYVTCSPVIDESSNVETGEVYVDMRDTETQPITWGIDRVLTPRELVELEKLILPIMRIFDRKIAEAVGGYLSQINEESCK